MGISDREYYRDKASGVGFLSGEAPGCKAIILVNAILFVGQKLSPNLEGFLEATSRGIFHDFQVWRLITATFLHESPLHIVVNMLILWSVGRMLERIYETRDFVAMYLMAALFSTFCWAVVDGVSRTHHEMIGASGAIMTVLVVSTLINPRQKILFVVFPIEMRWLLAIFLGFDLLHLLGGGKEGIAMFSHFGGALFGVLFKFGNLRLSRLDPLFDRRPKLRIVSAETRESTPTRATVGPIWSSNSPAPAPRPAASASGLVSDENFDEKLDQILAKIAQSGRGALSDDENRVLEEASRRARNRRSERI